MIRIYNVVSELVMKSKPIGARFKSNANWQTSFRNMPDSILALEKEIFQTDSFDDTFLFNVLEE